MFNIRIKVNGIDYIKKLENKIGKVSSYVSNYAYTNMQSMTGNYNNYIINKVIYGPGGVTKRTGALGKAFYTYLSKVNQYAFTINADFRSTVPYVRTHVGQGTQVITPKSSKHLYIPRSGGPANVYPRRPVSSFFNAYRKNLREIYVLSKMAKVPRRVDPGDIEDVLASRIDREMPKMASKAISNWKKENGI